MALPQYFKSQRPAMTQGPQIGAGALSSIRATNATNREAMASIARAGNTIAGVFADLGQEKIHAQRVDELSNFQTEVIGSFGQHYDKLRDNSNPETYQVNLTETTNYLENDVLPKITDPISHAAAARYLNEEKTRNIMQTEQIADEVRKDKRQANLETNLQEMIRLGRIDRINPLIDAAQAGNTVTATQAVKIKEDYQKIAIKETDNKLKTAQLAVANRIGGEGGLQYLLKADGLDETGRKEVINSYNFFEEQRRKSQAADMENIQDGLVGRLGDSNPEKLLQDIQHLPDEPVKGVGSKSWFMNTLLNRDKYKTDLDVKMDLQFKIDLKEPITKTDIREKLGR